MMWQLAHAFGSVLKYESPSAYPNVNSPTPSATPAETAAAIGIPSLQEPTASPRVRRLARGRRGPKIPWMGLHAARAERARRSDTGLALLYRRRVPRVGRRR